MSNEVLVLFLYDLLEVHAHFSHLFISVSETED